jgi:uncharacterized membrane-anchored protein YitT (DUF2179 family)
MNATAVKPTARIILRDATWMLLGVLCAAFGLESFLIPGGFIDGGATGVALMLERFTPLTLPIALLLVNIPFVYLAYRHIGKGLAVRALSGIIVLALATSVLHFPEVTHDKLLVAVFGGFFLGAGIGLALRGGGVIDGTEVLAIVISRKLPITLGDVVTIVNVVIFGVAAWLLGTETAMYSMITYLAAARTVDFVAEGIDEYIGITIISPEHDRIRAMITEEMGRGLTVYRGQRGFHQDKESDTDILFCVITRLEVSKFSEEVEKIDPNAFVVMTPVRDTRGGIVKARRHKH